MRNIFVVRFFTITLVKNGQLSTTLLSTGAFLFENPGKYLSAILPFTKLLSPCCNIGGADDDDCIEYLLSSIKAMRPQTHLQHQKTTHDTMI